MCLQSSGQILVQSVSRFAARVASVACARALLRVPAWRYAALGPAFASCHGWTRARVTHCGMRSFSHSLVQCRSKRTVVVDRAMSGPGSLCVRCGNPGKSRCAKCKAVNYCGPVCQREHWARGHKGQCKIISEGVALADVADVSASSKPVDLVPAIPLEQWYFPPGEGEGLQQRSDRANTRHFLARQLRFSAWPTLSRLRKCCAFRMRAS